MRRAAILAVLLAGASAAASPPGVDAFWSWWSTARPQYEKAITSMSPALQQELSAHVHAIDPDMSWEIGPNPAGGFILNVTGEGVFKLRRLAAAWERAAPKERAGWLYLPAREPKRNAANLSLDISGAKLDVAQATFDVTVDTSHARLDLKVQHPGFAKLAQGDRVNAAFILLDTILGEDDVERWIGKVEIAPAPAKGARDAKGLLAEVAKLAAAQRGRKEQQFTIAHGLTAAGKAILAGLDLTLKRLDHMDQDQHLSVVLPFAHADERGMPSSEEFIKVEALEDELVAAIGPRALYYGHIVTDGAMTVFFYAASRDAAVDRWVAGHTDRKVRAEWRADPDWNEYSRY